MNRSLNPILEISFGNSTVLVKGSSSAVTGSFLNQESYWKTISGSTEQEETLRLVLKCDDWTSGFPGEKKKSLIHFLSKVRPNFLDSFYSKLSLKNSWELSLSSSP